MVIYQEEGFGHYPKKYFGALRFCCCHAQEYDFYTNQKRACENKCKLFEFI